MHRIARAAVAAGAALAGVALVPSVAWAAGSGYSPPSSGSTTTAPGGFSDVLANQQVGSAGGTLTTPVGSATVTIDVPSGTFSSPVDVTVTTPTDTAAIPNAVVAFSISVESNGAPVSGTFSAITVTVKDSALVPGDSIDYWNGSSYVAYPNATVGNGTATITITSDPTFVVMPPATTSNEGSTTVAGATTPHTGIPVDGILLAGAAALVTGGAALIALRRS